MAGIFATSVDANLFLLSGPFAAFGLFRMEEVNPSLVWLGAPALFLAAVGSVITVFSTGRGRIGLACALSMLGFVGYILYRIRFSEVAHLARHDLIFCVAGFSTWAVTAGIVTTPARRFTLVAAFFALIAVNFLLGLYQQFEWKNANQLWFMGVDRSLKSIGDSVFTGLFPNSNHLAGQMELTGFIALAFAVFGGVHSFVRVICGVFFAMAAATTILSTSRGGWIAFMIGLLVFFIMANVLSLVKRDGRVGARTLGILLSSLLVVAAVSHYGWQIMGDRMGENAVSAIDLRRDMADRAIAQWQQEPLLGTGARSYEYYERTFRDFKTPWISWRTPEGGEFDAHFAHHDWAQLLGDYGLIGLLLALAVFGCHLARGTGWLFTRMHQDHGKGSRLGDFRGSLLLGSIAGLVAFAAHCVSDFQLHIGANAAVCGCLLGILCNPGQLVPASSESKGIGLKPLIIFPGALAAAWVLWPALNWTRGELAFFEGSRIYKSKPSERRDEGFSQLLSAARLFKQASLHDDKNYHAYYFHGLCHLLNGERQAKNERGGQKVILSKQYFQKALREFEVGHALYPKNPFMAMYAGQATDYLAMHDATLFPAAEKYHIKALEWGQCNYLVHNLYGDHLFLKKDWAKAMKVYEGSNLWLFSKKRFALIANKIEICKKMLEKEKPGPAPATP